MQALCAGRLGRKSRRARKPLQKSKLVEATATTEDETCSTVIGEEATEESTTHNTLLSLASPPEPELADDQICCWVAKSLQAMSRASKPSEQMSGFRSVSQPPLSLRSYAARIQEYFMCTPECFVLSLVYIERIVKRNPQIMVTDLTCHRLLLTSVAVSAKFHDDEFYGNEYYATIGGIATPELNALEEEFLQLLGWRLYVGADEYSLFLRTLRSKMEDQEAETDDAATEGAEEEIESEDARDASNESQDDW